MKRLSPLLISALLLGSQSGRAIDSKSAPRPVPLTRPEMKEYLEDMKARKPRIPLPELTDADREKLGERSQSYESRLRYHYLGGDVRGSGQGGGGRQGAGSAGPATPSGFAAFNGGRDSDPEMSLTYQFKVELFWIVSRTNNCQYCLGHQESKLLAAGMTEDQIAALDSDWASFPAADQAAFAFARKFTYQPNELSDDDIKALQKHYSDSQILEMILSMAWNNAINRWKEGAGIPQSQNGGGFGRRTEGRGGAVERPQAPAASADAHQSYLTPTSERFQQRLTSVAPLVIDKASGKPTRMTVCERPPLESRDDTEALLTAATQRVPRLPLVDEVKTRELMEIADQSSPVPQWMRLLANFPSSVKSRVAAIQASESMGDLSPLLKAQMSWIIARQDRAWYAMGEARQRLLRLGQSADQIYQLDGDWKDFSATDRALFTVAKKLAATPVVLTDDDVHEAVIQAGPKSVVQAINYVTSRASFDRITESAGLAIDP